MYPGFEGLGFPEREKEEPYIFHFPDGNASVARLLVRVADSRRDARHHDGRRGYGARGLQQAGSSEARRCGYRLNSTVGACAAAERCREFTER